MRTVAEIKQDILALPKAEYAELLEWLTELESDEWDKEIEEDAKAGRLDFLRSRSLEAKRDGTLGYL